MAFDSSSEVPGTVTTLTVSAPSLNSGRKAEPSAGTAAAVRASAAPAPASTRFGCRSTSSNTPA